ncbi:hypothetical protein BJX62DRAFT_242202 [Aspergillus germanicus]
MEISELQLSVPSVYLLLEASDQAEVSSLAGCVSMAAFISDLPALTGSLPRIAVSLVRCVRIEEFDSTTTRHREPVRQKIRFWKQPSPSRRTIPTVPRTSRVQRQTIARNDICHAPDEICRHGSQGRTWLRFNFHIPLSTNLARSIDTVGGSIFYTIEVTVSSPACGDDPPQLHASRPINIVHCAIPRTIAHLRRYPGDSATTQLYVKPLSTRKGISYALNWLALSTVSCGARPSELKYIVAKELHWSIQETVKCLAVKGETTTCLHQYTRRLSEGQRKGRWVAPGGLEDGNDSIQISFEVSIPRGIDVSDTASLASNQDYYSALALDSEEEQLALTVDHRLNLEVVTGEDTFHRGTGDLLDRRYPVKSFKATFPLQVRQHTCEDFSSPAQTREIPPVYEEPYPAPPGYEAT